MHFFSKSIFINESSYCGPLGNSLQTAFRSMLKHEVPIMEKRSKMETIVTIRDLVAHITSEPKRTFFSPFSYVIDNEELSGNFSIGFTNQKTSTQVKAIGFGRSVMDAMSSVSGLVDRVDVMISYGDRSTCNAEFEAARHLRIPYVSCLKGNFANCEDLGDILSILFSIQSLSMQIIPFGRGWGLRDSPIVNRNIAGGQSLENMIVNTRCSSTNAFFSLLFAKEITERRGLLGRQLRNMYD